MDDLDVSLTRGTLDLLILKALSWGPRHDDGVVAFRYRIPSSSSSSAIRAP